MVIASFVLAAALAAPASATSAADRARAYYHFSLGQQSRLAGEVDEALEEYRKAVAIDPASGELRSELARMLRESGRAPEARSEERRVGKECIGRWCWDAYATIRA